jgi:hypothetical protein
MGGAQALVEDYEITRKSPSGKGGLLCIRLKGLERRGRVWPKWLLQESEGAPAGSWGKSKVRVASKMRHPLIASYKKRPSQIIKEGRRPFIHGISLN